MTNILIFISILFVSISGAAAQQPPASIGEQQLSEITQTLRNVLEENRRLSERNEETDARVKDLEKQFENIQKTSLGNAEDIEFIKKEQVLLQEENERLKKIIQDFKVELTNAVVEQEADALKFSGQDYSAMGVSQKSDLLAKKAADVERQSADIYDQMADEAFSKGEYQQAIDYYEKYLALNPNSTRISQIKFRIQAAQTKLGQQ